MALTCHTHDRTIGFLCTADFIPGGVGCSANLFYDAQMNIIFLGALYFYSHVLLHTILAVGEIVQALCIHMPDVALRPNTWCVL